MPFKSYQEYIDIRKQNNLYRSLQTQSDERVRQFFDFASNDYLGLSSNTAIIQAGSDAALKYGAGAKASRFVSGNCDFFMQTEEKLAQFKKKNRAFFLPSGFQTNISVISALLAKELFTTPPLVLCDKYNHASIYQAIQLSQAQMIRYRHNDMNHLEDLLKKHSSINRPIFIITETVFSMDGDITNLDILCRLAKQYNALTIIDDAHSVGVLGKNGAGLTVNYPEIDIVIGTASKAFGLQGGYVACNHDIMDYLQNSAKGFIYSTGVSPFLFGALNKALDIIPTLNQLRTELFDKVNYLRQKLHEININTLHSSTQIIPAVFSDNQTVMALEKILFENGFLVKAIRSPTVPFSTPRLRLTLNPAISYEMINLLITQLSTFINN